jgi:hypothetical protein
MATLTVGAGSGFEYSTLSAAIAASQDGDVIQVQAGTYTNDFATITTNITIEGVGGMVNLVANEPPPNGKGMLTIGTGSSSPDVTLYNISVSGAEISDADGGNAAGIRYQAGNLTLNNCDFYDNQDGLLATPEVAGTGTITINNTEFSDNGNTNPPSSGDEHNLYVGDIQQLTIDNSYFYDPIVGHDIKSRAESTTIDNSRIDDPNGTGSYEIDLPNGGNAVIVNNVIEKGADAQNPNFIAFGEEGGLYANSSLTVTGNTVENDYGAGATLVWNDTTVAASVTGNTVYGLTADQLVNGPVATPENNTFEPLSSEPALDTSPPYLPVVAFEFACFAAGTRIATERGEVAVEAIGVGERVRVLLGEGLAEVIWVGRRAVDCARHPTPRKVWPVRVAAGAFGPGRPHADLFLSPDHAVYVEEVLIPVRYLINGSTIVQVPVDRVTYHHLELAEHDVVLAEGLPAETFLDMKDGSNYANRPGPVRLYPDFTVRMWEAFGCARLIVTGKELTAARAVVAGFAAEQEAA